MTNSNSLIPLADVPRTAWGLLSRGADDPDHPMHVLTMATVAVDGRPSARLMAVRGVDPTGARLWFHTESHAPKCSEVRANPATALVAWDRSLGAEVRLSGTASVHERGELADLHWEHAVRVAGHITVERAAGSAFEADPRLSSLVDEKGLAAFVTARARASFAVIEVSVHQIDWFQVVGTSRRRAVLRADEAWRPCEVTA